MKRKLQVAEFTTKKDVARIQGMGVSLTPMSPKQQIPEKIMFRPTADDFNLVQRLGKRLGLGQTQIIRLALRRLADAEGLQQKAS